MLRLIILSVLLAAATSETNVNEIFGKWTPVASYLKGADYKSCESLFIKLDEKMKCSCGGAEVPVLNFYNVLGKSFLIVPSMFIDKSEDIEPKLDTECSCDGNFPGLVAVRKVHENYLILYAKSSEGGHVTNVFVRNMPKLSELKATLNSIPDLSGQEPSYLCEEGAFVKE